MNLPSNQSEKRTGDPGIDWRAVMVLAGVLVLGGVMVAGSEYIKAKLLHGLLQHLGSACIVAALMGLTYEVLMDRKRQRNHEAQIDNIRSAVLDAIAGLTQFTAPKLLGLLEDVARDLDRTPTLFPPARPGSECPFSSSPEYFDSIINSAKGDVIKIIGAWLHDSNPNLRFLASDFVGKHQFRQYASDMRIAADSVWLSGNWDETPDKTKQWVLNYYWALSVLDGNELQILRDVLLTARDSFTRLWILHVPLQMPDMEGLDGLIDAFMDRVSTGEKFSGRTSLSPEEARSVIKALAAIERSHESTNEGRGPALDLLKKHRGVLAGHRSFAAKACIGLRVKSEDLPDESVRHVTIRNTSADRIVLSDGNSDTAVLLPRQAVAKQPSFQQNDAAVLLGLQDDKGNFTPMYAELTGGVLAPVVVDGIGKSAGGNSTS